jgi:hypothetical protein
VTDLLGAPPEFAAAAASAPTCPIDARRRERFVSWMLVIGTGARDVLRAADLLTAVGCFVHSPVPRVRELALAAIGRSLT